MELRRSRSAFLWSDLDQWMTFSLGLVEGSLLSEQHYPSKQLWRISAFESLCKSAFCCVFLFSICLHSSQLQGSIPTPGFKTSFTDLTMTFVPIQVCSLKIKIPALAGWSCNMVTEQRVKGFATCFLCPVLTGSYSSKLSSKISCSVLSWNLNSSLFQRTLFNIFGTLHLHELSYIHQEEKMGSTVRMKILGLWFGFILFPLYSSSNKE